MTVEQEIVIREYLKTASKESQLAARRQEKLRIMLKKNGYNIYEDTSPDSLLSIDELISFVSQGVYHNNNIDKIIDCIINLLKQQEVKKTEE